MTGSNDYINGKIFRAEEIKDRIKNAKKYECVAMENFKPKKKWLFNEIINLVSIFNLKLPNLIF